MMKKAISAELEILNLYESNEFLNSIKVALEKLLAYDGQDFKKYLINQKYLYKSKVIGYNVIKEHRELTNKESIEYDFNTRMSESIHGYLTC